MSKNTTASLFLTHFHRLMNAFTINGTRNLNSMNREGERGREEAMARKSSEQKREDSRWLTSVYSHDVP